MISFFRYSALVILFILLMPLSAFGQLQGSNSIAGLPGAPFRMGFGARGIAMGNALTAVKKGELQSYYNPALTPFGAAPTLTIAYGVLSLDRKLNFLSYTQGLKGNAGIALSIINAGVGDIYGTDGNAVHTQIYSTSENAFMLSFGLRPDPKLSIGVSVKILYFVLYDQMKSTTAAVDIGAAYILSDDFTLGFVLQDINGKYKWDSSPLYGINGNTQVDNFPLRKRIALSWNPSTSPIILAGELELIGSAHFFRLGSEVEIHEGIHIRGGIDQATFNTEQPAKPSLGVSLQSNTLTWKPAFQYTYVFEPFSPSGIHILSFSLRFP